ncbi:MAG TPA: hypothetical protein VLI04_21635 [Nocardioidaceae bacterium]|nr:hypothetical protein [Nocardioidaceae bacterium]
MSRLMAKIELQKLASALSLDEAKLGYLDALEADELRELRDMVSGALYSHHETRFGRMAAVSKLVPSAISAKASQLVGPALSAQVAGALDPHHAVKLAKAMRPEFLADVATFLDPARVTAIVQLLPDTVIVPVGKTLLKRGAFLTLGRFTSIVDPDTALKVTEDADGHELLTLALYTEDRPAIDAIVTKIADFKLRAAMAAAAKNGDFDEALALMEVLTPSNRARVIDEAAHLDHDDRNELMAGVIRNDSWDMLMEALDRVSHDALKAVVNVPSTAETAVIDVLLEQAIKADRTEAFEAILLALDAAHVTAMSASKVLKGAEFKTWVEKTPGLGDRLSGVLAKVS